MIYWLYLVQYLHLTEAIGVCFEYLLHGGHRSNDPFLGSSICWWWWRVGLKGGLWWLFCITLVNSLALPLFIYRGHVCGISCKMAVDDRLLMTGGYLPLPCQLWVAVHSPCCVCLSVAGVVGVAAGVTLGDNCSPAVAYVSWLAAVFLYAADNLVPYRWWWLLESHF